MSIPTSHIPIHIHPPSPTRPPTVFLIFTFLTQFTHPHHFPHRPSLPHTKPTSCGLRCLPRRCRRRRRASHCPSCCDIYERYGTIDTLQIVLLVNSLTRMLTANCHFYLTTYLDVAMIGDHTPNLNSHQIYLPYPPKI